VRRNNAELQRLIDKIVLHKAGFGHKPAEMSVAAHSVQKELEVLDKLLVLLLAQFGECGKGVRIGQFEPAQSSRAAPRNQLSVEEE
jgi:hypothetical protein